MAGGPAATSTTTLLRRRDALTLLAMYISAIVHDYDHRGVTNAFLIQDRDPLAVSKQDIPYACIRPCTLCYPCPRGEHLPLSAIAAPLQ